MCRIEMALDDKKQDFYEQLVSALHKIPKGDITVITEHLHPKIESENTKLENIMGKRGLKQWRTGHKFLHK